MTLTYDCLDRHLFELFSDLEQCKSIRTIFLKLSAFLLGTSFKLQPTFGRVVVENSGRTKSYMNIKLNI